MSLEENNMVSIIKINDHAYIGIDHQSSTIEFMSYGIGPVIKIHANKSMICKTNKKSISTCNTYLLSYYLKKRRNAARAIYAYFSAYPLNDHETVEKYDITTAGYFSRLNDRHFEEIIEYFHLRDSDALQASTIKKIILNYLFCTDHEAKMIGMISCSTSVELNPYCQARRKNCPGGICEHCFSASQLERYILQSNKLKKAHMFFTTCRIYPEDVPQIKLSDYKYFRFESFGDLSNVLQFMNYCTIASTLKQNCALWTKNPGIIKNAIDNYSAIIPGNMHIVLSSLYVNNPVTIEYLIAHEYMGFISAVFTVYTKEYAAQNNININCGARSCLTCGCCYNLNSHKIKFVNELLK